MKRILITLTLIATLSLLAVAQDSKPTEQKRKRRFSPEQFQEKQRNYIIEKANLTPEEADAFFPIFFELQKKKFCIERESREKVIKERGQKLSDEQMKELLTNTADARISIAQLEKEYIAKYLNAISPKKLIDIQRAERSFQSYIIKSMTRDHHRKDHKKTFDKRNNKETEKNKGH